MTEFYRFRNIEKLLGPSFQELEKQTVFFASPDELNDPMEGFQDLVWSGDHILWSNLLKHYVYCLSYTCMVALVFGNEDNLEPVHIPIRLRWDTEPTPQAVELFDVVWEKVQDKCGLEDLTKGIAGLEFSGIKHKVRRAELLFYLQLIHLRALTAIQQVLVTRGLIKESQRIALNLSRENPLTSKGYFELVRQVPEIDTSSSEKLYLEIETLLRSIPLRRRFVAQEVGMRNAKFLVADFPSIYVDQLRRLLWPEWYAACFAKGYHNSSLWANYGDAHRGACLIFEADEEGEQARLKLKQVTGRSSSRDGGVREHWDFAPMPFHEVRYQVKPDEVDFFRSMGQPSMDALLKLWYTDENGSLSDCATQIFGPDSDINAWQKRHWDDFIRDACFKTKDWEYEQEFRLTLNSGLEGSLCKRKRTLTYDFDSLKGIAFGIRTSDDDKLAIVDILTRKCRENQRTGFKFLQAYYSPETGDIRSHEIPANPIVESGQDGPD